jgi:hypothetical protein
MSDDNGWTWSEPIQTAIWGYPAHLLALPDGRVICVYGYRAQPYGIRLVVSYDGCNSWETSHILSIRDDLPNKNLGYPSSVLADDGSIYTVYYGESIDGITSIQASQYFIEE